MDKMPYIPKKRREEIDSGEIPLNAGELNYKLTMACIEYIRNNPKGYQIYNDIMGALEGCKIELYRKHISIYEDIKINQNGDI